MEPGKKTRVSFCMSTYKRPGYLKDTLGAILQQSFTDFEIVVSDNDPGQSARDVVSQIKDDRVKYFSNGEDIGMIASFNKSIERSSGGFIVMITDDDPVYPFMLSELMQLQDKHPGYGVYAGCGDIIIDNEIAGGTLQKSSGTHSRLLDAIPPDGDIAMAAGAFAEAYLDGFFTPVYLLWSCALIRREVILSINGLPAYGSELLADHAFVIAAGSKQGVVYLNKALGGQTIHGGNFGYDFDKLKDKYVKTPVLFYNYLETHLKANAEWGKISKKIWNFAGRAWVEYSLMHYLTFRQNGASMKVFWKYFQLAFSNSHIRKWKYKFYLKTFFRPLFSVLLKIKNFFKK